uniref:Putative ovule protein n=1 Tax=Solanum chacoense TaxID=4108 RepID=A0A0V0GT85_SOLCH
MSHHSSLSLDLEATFWQTPKYNLLMNLISFFLQLVSYAPRRRHFAHEVQHFKVVHCKLHIEIHRGSNAQVTKIMGYL